MKREDLDVMWSIATKKSIEDNEPFTRYEFAKMVAAEAVSKEQERIVGLLKGIADTECGDPNGWWETSTGANFGAEILRKIRGEA